MNPLDALAALFGKWGATPFATFALLSLHAHLFLILRRLRAVEQTPTVQRELNTAVPSK